MEEDRFIADHFVVAGLPPENPEPLEEFSCDGASLKNDHSLSPITDIGVVNTTLGEQPPDGQFFLPWIYVENDIIY